MRRPPIIDLHQDISYYYVSGASGLNFPLDDFSKDIEGRHGDIPKFRRANVSIVFSSMFCLLPTVAPDVIRRLSAGYASTQKRAWTPRATHSTALEHLKVYYFLEEMHSPDLVIIRRMEDVERAMRGSFIGFLVALEGAYAIEDVYDVKLFYNMGVRSLQPAWNFDSRYCATCMSKTDYGLTGEGEELVRECNKLGIILDLAHASRKTHLDIIQASSLPVLNSHSNARQIHDVSRNLDDEAYEAIKGNGGVVGSIFSQSMTGRNMDLQSLADHIIYVWQRFGPDIMALGSDYFGLIDSAPPRGLEDITKVEKLFASLLDRGMSEAEIEKLAYGNALRVIKENAKHWP